ncbi:ABC transporter, permease protein [Marvinbryantia formatexigens DSM 14469]|uniref:ABC transporter, permease protein n=1 Tax=Marvinbryantia formatexigens DSM 14469 TaxID=478749 RepID=C6LGR5_9FIRM|nr:sugar ABC transporter permease [Marvinbryantia formatexigens]EET60265.1 ABC transporter, permease protein [Marvinbryantia formatexigens DSM 14469]UWO24284.1 sugar ABC transporter permease [Marvinbryantia formatexigens DSM 14469]SDF56078.1 carbohydrate ABC transporter membrane protein 1, CUT1 family (TC 3.A.1.1.-) [Marvinbryantia formatexigens]
METKKKRKMTRTQRENLAGHLFVAPAVICFTIFVGIPIIVNVGVLSFAEFSLLGDFEWVGLKNFRDVFRDSSTYTILKNTLRLFLVLVPTHIIGGLIAATAINAVRNHFFHTIFRIALYFPMVVTTASVALVWGYLYDTDFGVFNWILSQFGIDKIRFLGDQHWALLSIAIFSAWKFIGNAFLYYYIGLRNIPETYMEAAKLDGASTWQAYIHVKLPLLTPTIFFVVTTTLINCFQVFDEPYFLTNGGPGVSSQTLAMQIYRKGFGQYHFGYASALGVILFVMVITVTFIMFGTQNKWVTYDTE